MKKNNHSNLKFLLEKWEISDYLVEYLERSGSQSVFFLIKFKETKL
ncbi:hypothetical protein F480_09500 [Bibersteinia trehalosi Y31]|uniref:Uncharacterized protein n=1 Tax=Bibersteinia trehalosi Y31 TaxID=1261658 RepID=A0A179CYG2_BIBTR|nr:hypothetical protein F480_09500 [Bibersteinia trehalosi Y31]